MLRMRLQHMGLRIFSMIVLFGVFLSLSYRLTDSSTYLYLSLTAFFLFVFNLFWHPQFFQFSVMKVGRNKAFHISQIIFDLIGIDMVFLIYLLSSITCASLCSLISCGSIYASRWGF